jgi:hypothetical protein
LICKCRFQQRKAFYRSRFCLVKLPVPRPNLQIATSPARKSGRPVPMDRALPDPHSRRELASVLGAQFRDMRGGELRSLYAVPGGDVIRHGRNLVV